MAKPTEQDRIEATRRLFAGLVGGADCAGATAAAAKQSPTARSGSRVVMVQAWFWADLAEKRHDKVVPDIDFYPASWCRNLRGRRTAARRTIAELVEQRDDVDSVARCRPLSPPC